LARRVDPTAPHAYLSGAVVGGLGKSAWLRTNLGPTLVRSLRELAGAHGLSLELYTEYQMLVERLTDVTELHARRLGVQPLVSSFQDLRSLPLQPV
jgi:hypothetical protein